jgi:hypothetical protein
MAKTPGDVVYAEALLAGCSSAPPVDLPLPAAEAAAWALQLVPPLAALEPHTQWQVNFRSHCGPLRRFLADSDAAAVQMGGAAAGVLLKLDKHAGTNSFTAFYRNFWVVRVRWLRSQPGARSPLLVHWVSQSTSPVDTDLTSGRVRHVSIAGVAQYVRAVTAHDASTAAATLVSLVGVAGGLGAAPLELLRSHPEVVAAMAAMDADRRGRYLVDASCALPASFGTCAPLLRTMIGPALEHDPLSTARHATGVSSLSNLTQASLVSSCSQYSASKS